MVLPTTALQVEMMVAAWRREQDNIVETMKRIYFPPLLDRLLRLTIKRRPCTDDMMQMCVDLGVDVPDRNFTSPDGLTFIWR